MMGRCCTFTGSRIGSALLCGLLLAGCPSKGGGSQGSDGPSSARTSQLVAVELAVADLSGSDGETARVRYEDPDGERVETVVELPWESDSLLYEYGSTLHLEVRSLSGDHGTLQCSILVEQR